MFKRIGALIMTLLVLTSAAFSARAASAITLDDVNEFLNRSSALGEGGKANPVAVIPMNHIDGPKEEDPFYAFVTFKYVARNYIKYQVSYLSCTCRSADVNYWTTAYVDLTLPSSGKLDDAAVKTLSFGKDGTGRYDAAFWGDSNPVPTGGQTFEMFNNEYIPYYVGKTYGELKNLSTIGDIVLADYQAGEGRANYTLDTLTGATVSANNLLRMLQSLMQYHGTDPFFENDESLKMAMPAQAAETAAEENKPAKAETMALIKELPAPVDTARTYKATKDATEETPCEPGNFGPTCSAINNTNLKDYLGRSDVMYIDTRDYADYAKKHLRNFECVPFFALIYNEKANTDNTLVQLYGGSVTDPVPVYEESDMILEALFPKNKTLFLMCQSGGRVKLLMNILKARGWDMSKIYNIGGMAQYSGAEYRGIVNDAPEIILEGSYRFDGLTRK